MKTKTVLCACGCGTKITAKETDKRTAFFVHGHNRRGLPSHNSGKGKKHSNETKPCECGCGAEIKKWQINGKEGRFVRGHQFHGKPGWRLGVGKHAQHRGEKILCACGCGTTIDYLRKNGMPQKFVYGHQTKNKPSKRKGTGKKHSTETILCACGCGTLIPKYGKNGRTRSYAPRHYWRGKPGPMKGKKQPDSQREKLSVYHSIPGNSTAEKNSRGIRTQYDGVMFKSKSEALRAQQLDAAGYHWKYEPCVLEYLDNDGRKHRYTPDFWVDELQRYEEIKGYMNENDAQKMNLVLKSNPLVKIAIVYPNRESA